MPRILKGSMRSTGFNRRLTTPVVLLALAAAGCAETEFVAGSVKRLSPASDPTPQYKVGKPYRVNGVVYTPRIDYNYAETGIASWYGADFHGNATANGEVFDMNAVSAAHKTLPLPSMARITNLENGRWLNVRVNDRGPFARGRIIDVSRRTAQLLDFERKGTAMVRVEILARESRKLVADLTGRPVPKHDHPVPNAAPRVAVTSQELAPPPGVRKAPPPTASHRVGGIQKPRRPGQRRTREMATVDGQVHRAPMRKAPAIYVQAGAFSQYANAYRLKTFLSSLGPTKIMQADGYNARLFRVRLGPMRSVEEADAALGRVVASGMPNARIVVD